MIGTFAKPAFTRTRLLFLALAFVSPLAARPFGTKLILPPSGTGDTRGEGINVHGHVVGNYTTPTNRVRAFIHRNGVSSDLPEPVGTTSSGANGINASGVIVGSYRVTNLRACVWDGNVLTELPVPPGARDTVAHSINDAGLIVGSYTDASLDTHVCIWQGGNLVYPVKPMGATYSAAFSVGNNGTFVGNYQSAGGNRACQWGNAALVEVLPLPQGTTDSDVSGINNVGVAVGSAHSSMSLGQACVWQGASVFTLPSPGTGHSSAIDVNDGGQIVGEFFAEGNMAGRAWFWETGTPEFLPQPAGAFTTTAAAINDAGQIVVNYSFNSAPSRAAILEEAFRPTVKISGRKKVVTSKSRVTIRGTTTDFVDRVNWEGKGSEGKAKGTKPWVLPYRPKPGRNLVRVTAAGPGGTSKSARVVIVQH